MAKLIYNSIHDNDDELSTILDLHLFPKKIKRVFWIYNNQNGSVRGMHRHVKTNHFLVCLSGSCKIYTNNGTKERVFEINNPNQILHLEPCDWREMYEFSEDCVLTCFCDEYYDPNDYIVTPYWSENIENERVKMLEEVYI
jgi:dTDP-4-dehydrorhamnose 3,5-epimerase-like enzyme